MTVREALAVLLMLAGVAAVTCAAALAGALALLALAGVCLLGVGIWLAMLPVPGAGDGP